MGRHGHLIIALSLFQGPTLFKDASLQQDLNTNVGSRSNRCAPCQRELVNGLQKLDRQ
jgi:hypothetical protein